MGGLDMYLKKAKDDQLSANALKVKRALKSAAGQGAEPIENAPSAA